MAMCRPWMAHFGKLSRRQSGGRAILGARKRIVVGFELEHVYDEDGVPPEPPPWIPTPKGDHKTDSFYSFYLNSLKNFTMLLLWTIVVGVLVLRLLSVMVV
ncbi:unnamed protein product [Cuscuta europaea]|uniref:Uncharacterized protein n=1 Tax=Cuscuta europaea TaxID=41803 RepID=A0A9P0YWF3_CUSEU|nr:unnamed protein product [Cuscuta europaea]